MVYNPLKLVKMVCTPLKTRYPPSLDVFETFPKIFKTIQEHFGEDEYKFIDPTNWF